MACTITKHSSALYIGMAKVLPIIDVLGYDGQNSSSQSTVVLCIQVNEKSCRLRMGAYRDRVKRKGDKIVMGL